MARTDQAPINVLRFQRVEKGGNEVPITYRVCAEEDIDDVLALWSSSAHGGSTNTATALEIRLQRDRELFHLAWDGDLLVGCLMGGWDGWRANMYRLAVLPDYRRRGIGSELVRRVEDVMRGLGVRRVYALAASASPGAMEFWHRVGYGPNTVVEPLARTLEPAR